MSSRPRRALLGLAVAAAALAALPASALAAGEGLTVTPSNPQAGGTTNVTETLTFAPGETPKTVVTSLAPGMLGNLNANPGCLLTQQLTTGCHIGTATVTTNATPPITGDLYLVPAQGSDAAGIEFVPAPASGASNQYIGVTLNPKAPGGLNLTTTFGQLPAGVQVTGFTANFTTLNGQEFTRLPSSCSAATSTFDVTYASGATGSASGSFTPTGCANLPYAPALNAAITKAKHGSGATIVTGITQAANQAASQKIVLTFPRGLTPNVPAVGPCLTGTGSGCTIGTATATSPLVPSAALAHGSVILGGTITAPTLSISFPAPFALTITGSFSVTNNSVTFANVPDVPLSSLTLTVTGPNGQKAFNTNCAPANVGGTFTPQSGTAAKTVSAKIKFTNCSFKPTVSGKTSGLRAGHPKLTFKVKHGKGAPKVRTVTLGLPGGLKFSRSAITHHKTCTGTGKKKKCSSTTLIKGLRIAGARAKSVAIKRGKLVVTLKRPAGTVTITASGPLVSESKGLQTKVRKHKTKRLKFTLKVTDAKHKSTTLSLKLRAH